MAADAEAKREFLDDPVAEADAPETEAAEAEAGAEPDPDAPTIDTAAVIGRSGLAAARAALDRGGRL